MKHVRQEDRSGCGIACAAMIAGLPYKAVKDWSKAVCGVRVDELDAVGSGAGLRIAQVIDLLNTLQKPVPVVTAPAILVVQKEHGIQHFVVVTETGEILDPAKG